MGSFVSLFTCVSGTQVEHSFGYAYSSNYVHDGPTIYSCQIQGDVSILDQAE